MSLAIISNNIKVQKESEIKQFIILDQKERMYLSKVGLFVSDKNLALGINNKIVAAMALVKINELRVQQGMKVLCILACD